MKPRLFLKRRKSLGRMNRGKGKRKLWIPQMNERGTGSVLSER